MLMRKKKKNPEPSDYKVSPNKKSMIKRTYRPIKHIFECRERANEESKFHESSQSTFSFVAIIGLNDTLNKILYCTPKS